MNEEKRQHLEFIQNVITRMNTNSFQIKGMTITIVSALLAIYVATSNVVFIFISIAPTILFWFSDTYCLQQERKFRGIYNNVAEIESDIEIKPYEMPTRKFKSGKYRFFRVFILKTIGLFYASIIVILLLAGIILKFNDGIIINCK